MRRYRKGQIYRPPTAAEHSALADAAEAHRRFPARPQDYRPVGQIVEVKTPAGGIAARDGATIYWEWCERCIHTDSGDNKTRVDTAEPIAVHNLLNTAIPGNSYVRTGLTNTGLRHVLLSTEFSGEHGLASIRFSSFTIGDFESSGLTYPTVVGSSLEVGDSKVSWNAGTQTFDTSENGTYFIRWYVVYGSPAGGWSETEVNPALTTPAASYLRRHAIFITSAGQTDSGAFAEHTNFKVPAESVAYRLECCCVTNMSTLSGVQVSLSSKQWPSDLSQEAWPVAGSACLLDFVRLNNSVMA